MLIFKGVGHFAEISISRELSFVGCMFPVLLFLVSYFTSLKICSYSLLIIFITDNQEDFSFLSSQLRISALL